MCARPLLPFREPCNAETFCAQAYESVVVGLFSIITGKRCVPPRPYKRGGEQDAVYVGFSVRCASSHLLERFRRLADQRRIGLRSATASTSSGRPCAAKRSCP